MNKKILITGGSGFIGSFLVEEALRQGHEVWAIIRKTSSITYLQDSRIHLLEATMGNANALKAQLQKALTTMHTSDSPMSSNRWDYVIHCAGLTKTVDKQKFDTVNYQHTVHLVESLEALDARPERFVLMSSLSIFGPIHEKDYTPISLKDTPQPNTSYGKSKLKAEVYLQNLKEYPYIIMRPTGVYGPRDKDYFLMAKSIAQHIDTAVGYTKQIITFIYVQDVVDAVYTALAKGVKRTSYFLSDGQEYNSTDYSDLLRRELGNPWMIRIRFPLWILWGVSALLEGISKLTKRPSTLNLDKYHIMKQRNWRCDISAAQKDFGYQPKVTLTEGAQRCIQWYKQEKWL